MVVTQVGTMVVTQGDNSMVVVHGVACLRRMGLARACDPWGLHTGGSMHGGDAWG